MNTQEATHTAQQERAFAAVKKARRYLNAKWRPFVRMLARDSKLSVDLTTGSSYTDGQGVVKIQVPIALGNKVDHRRPLCGERDEMGILFCDGCRAEEDVQVSVYHEVGHLLSKSFDSMTEQDLVQMTVSAVKVWSSTDSDGGKNRAAKIESEVRNAMENYAPSFVVASKFVSPHFGTLVNALEDVRVNSSITKARPGVAASFKGWLTALAVKGYEDFNGVHHPTNEGPLNFQMITAIMLACQDVHVVSTLVDEKVGIDLQDPKLNKLMERVRRANSIRDIFYVSFAVLERLRELGYLLDPEDPEDDPKPGEGDPEKSDESNESEEGDGTSSPSDSDDESDESEDEGDADGESSDEESDDEAEANGGGESEESDDAPAGDKPEESENEGTGKQGPEAETEEGTGGNDQGDSEDGADAPAPEGTPKQNENMGTPDEVAQAVSAVGGHGEGQGGGRTNDSPTDKAEMEKAIKQAAHFDTAATGCSGLEIFKGEGDAYEQWNEGTMQDNPWFAPFEIDPRILGQAKLPLRRAFQDNVSARQERNQKRGKRIDGRSMGRRIATDDPRIFKTKTIPGRKDHYVLIGFDVSGSTWGDTGRLIRETVYYQAELMHATGVTFEVIAHAAGMSEVHQYLIKEAHEPWGPAQKELLAHCFCDGGNLDGHSLEFYRKRAQARPETTKTILYYTDGAMPAGNYDEELVVLQENIGICRKLGILLVGVGVGTDSPKEHGLDTLLLNGVEGIPSMVKELGKRLGARFN